MSELLSWHRVGQKVVCVIPSGSLCKGAVYTIAAVLTHYRDGVPGLRLREVDNDPRYLSWHPWRFKPVRATSIDCFLSLLHPTPDDARPFFEETVRESLDA